MIRFKNTFYVLHDYDILKSGVSIKVGEWSWLFSCKSYPFY